MRDAQSRLATLSNDTCPLQPHQMPQSALRPRRFVPSQRYAPGRRMLPGEQHPAPNQACCPVVVELHATSTGRLHASSRCQRASATPRDQLAAQLPRAADHKRNHSGVAGALQRVVHAPLPLATVVRALPLHQHGITHPMQDVRPATAAAHVLVPRLPVPGRIRFRDCGLLNVLLLGLDPEVLVGHVHGVLVLQPREAMPSPTQTSAGSTGCQHCPIMQGTQDRTSGQHYGGRLHITEKGRT